MAKLTISDASRVAGVARSTLHRAIKNGRISLDPDGRLDTAELLRCGYTLQGVAQHERNISLQRATPQKPGARQVAMSASDMVMEALQRERDLLQQQLDATRDLLQSERQAALERERESRSREALLLQMLHEAQQRYDRLLEAPKPSVPAGELRTSAPSTSMRAAPTVEAIPVPSFDPKKYALGKLCPRGHEYGKTGQTLLRLPHKSCPQCENEKKRERRRQARAGG